MLEAILNKTKDYIAQVQNLDYQDITSFIKELVDNFYKGQVKAIYSNFYSALFFLAVALLAKALGTHFSLFLFEPNL